MAAAQLQERLGDNFFPAMWIRYFENSSERWCQPDGIHIDVLTGRITIFEMKIRHTFKAWKQLKKYEQVLRIMFPAELWTFVRVEIFRWNDPSVRLPEAYRFCRQLSQASPAVHNMLILREGR